MITEGAMGTLNDEIEQNLYPDDADLPEGVDIDDEEEDDEDSWNDDDDLDDEDNDDEVEEEADLD